MKAKFNLTVLFAMAAVICLSACSGGYRYLPHTLAPRSYFVEDQVFTIQTVDDITSNKPVYIEFGTRDGKRESGSLLRITSHDIVYYDRSKDKAAVVGAGMRGKAKRIAKEEILFLKVW